MGKTNFQCLRIHSYSWVAASVPYLLGSFLKCAMIVLEVLLTYIFAMSMKDFKLPAQFEKKFVLKVRP